MSIINATNIHKKFGEGNLTTHVLTGIDVTVEEGEFVAIMGKSGAGRFRLYRVQPEKSTPMSTKINVQNSSFRRRAKRDVGDGSAMMSESESVWDGSSIILRITCW